MRKGIWTPWAMVVCYNCHGNIFLDKTLTDEEMAMHNEPVDLKEGNRITFCDTCGKDVQVYDSVAEEHNLVKELLTMGYDAYLEQTGGMNSACVLNIDHDETINDELGEVDPVYYLTYNFDGHNKYWLTLVDKDGESDGLLADTYTLGEMMAIINNLDDVRKIKEGTE